jgi:ribose/xylose/arabinose/galactoside ABC-type transport system permease subunit
MTVTTSETETNRSQRKSHGRLVDLGQRYGLLVILAGVVMFFSTYSKTSAAFPSQANLITMIGNSTVVCVVALAIVVPLVAGIFDLSAAATTGASSIATASVMSRFDGPLWLAVLAGLTVGATIGATNGLLITRLGLDPIIETLGMSILLGGVAIWYTGGLTVTGNISTTLTQFGSLNWWGLPRLLVVLVPVVLATWYLLEHTPYGRQLSAIGSNPKSARLVGIRVERMVWSSMTLGGLLAGIAGVLLCARAASADTNAGPSFLFPALAAVFLGATTIKPGLPNALGAIVGVFFVAIAVSGLSIAGAAAWAPGVFNGGSLLVAVWMTATLGRRRGPATR